MSVDQTIPPVDHIRYDLLVREALRTVVRRVVSDVAKNGLPGDHHFYISFDTGAEGAKISPRLRAQYPNEMTVVLQHQFWDLIVNETGFEVGLSFGGVPERLTVPFDAIKGFFDPSVQFGLEFEVAGDQTAAAKPDGADAPAKLAVVPALPAAAPPKSERRGGKAVKTPEAPPAKAEPDAEPIRQDGGGEVVRFDRFRKK
jgi:hypothetical protein